MKFFKYLAWMATTLICSLGARASTSEVLVGVYDLPPHIIIPAQGTPQGAAPQFLNKYVFQKSPLKVHWVAAHFARTMIDLENGRLDMVLLVAKTSERENKYIFSESPLYQTPSGIVVKKDSKIQKIQSLHDLQGLSLGHDLGSIVPDYFKETGVKFHFVSGQDYFKRNLRLLRSGRIDGFFVPTFSHGLYKLKKDHLLSEFSILEIPAKPLKLYIIFGKKTDPQLIKAVNTALKNHGDQYLKMLHQLL
ncbi:MAG: transporter substrate-binding domain-containing protein [Bdellovibrio sp.]|nr:transporter substrate-binding domain-containing protein [Bdellovibrio sp.]